jgi:hypothetical protein
MARNVFRKQSMASKYWARAVRECRLDRPKHN